MKKHQTFTKFANLVFISLLSLFGFPGCGKDKIELRVEYGTPRATFTVSGKVTDTQNQALPQVMVTIPKTIHETPARPGFIPDNPIITREIRDTLYTKPDGSFVYDYHGFPTDTVRIFFKFEDSAFKSDSTRVDFKHSDLKGGDGRWDKGSATKGANIRLTRKQSE